EARHRGWQVRGVEASPWAAAEARRRLGVAVHESLAALRAAAPEPCDAMTFFQVLEHLPDPAAALTAARTCLHPGGWLVVETWNRDSWAARLFGAHWQQVTPPSVIHLFARRDLEALLATTGFELHSVRRTSKWISAGFVAGLLAGKYPTVGGWLRQAVGVTGLGRLAVPYRLGDLITVVGRAVPQ
ncbi:MAG: class I SAM-dependent methyltransferase, partial [bacterium]|nr:class I SAM-dependent methyltransferase [bacterium]